MKTLLLSAGIAILAAHATLADDRRFVAAFAADDVSPLADLVAADIDVVSVYEGEGRSFAVLAARDETLVRRHLGAIGLAPERLLPVEFVNSPVVGGGEAAGEDPLKEHTLYVIERPIPGVGSFPLEKKQAISARSNASIAQLGGQVEWDRSYLTSEGTFCVYRAEDEDAIRRHGELSGAPIELITPVSSGE